MKASIPQLLDLAYQYYINTMVVTSCEGVSKSFRTGRLERKLQIVQLSATRCSCIAILCVSLVSFAAITLCVASERVFIVVSLYFVIDSVRKLLDTPSYDKCSMFVVKHLSMYVYLGQLFPYLMQTTIMQLCKLKKRTLHLLPVLRLI
jgi:hypothetical protein